MVTKDDLLQKRLDKIGKGNTTQIQFCYKAIFEAMDEFTEQETKELKQQLEDEIIQRQAAITDWDEMHNQLTEANALIEKMRLKLIESNEKVKELSTEGDDVTAQQYVYTSWLINEVNEYKSKQTTQEVKP